MVDLNELLATEEAIRFRIEKLIENGQKTGLPKRTQGFFESRTTELKKLWEEYAAIDIEIHKLSKKTKKEDKCDYIKDDRYGLTEVKYLDYTTDLLDGLRNLLNPGINNSETPNAANILQTHGTTIGFQESVLPKITIPKYDGEYETWRSFHDLFVSVVHDNPRLSSVQKLYHLKSCLIGEAEKLLRHTPITDVDYEPAWKKLKERYENKKMLVSHQLKILVNQPKIITEKFKDIKALVDTTNECLQQLKSLEVDTSSWDVLLVHILIQKIPYLTLRLWEENQATSQNLPKMNEFIEFLQKRLSIMEAVSDAIASNATRIKPPSKNYTCSTHLTTESNKCPACNQKHYVLYCKKYKQLTAIEKLKIIISSGRCINCFSKQHVFKMCPSTHRCSRCHEKHHTTLHDARNSTSLQNHSSNNKQTGNITNYLLDAKEAREYEDGIALKPRSTVTNGAASSSTIQTFIARKDHQSLLSTALVIAQGYNGKPQTLRCLLDTGSESSFITDEACQRLQASWKRTSTTITGLNTSHAAFATRQTTLILRSCGSETSSIKEDFFIIKQITDALPNKTIENYNHEHLNGLTLADPTYWQSGKIDALLGIQVFSKIIQEGVRRGKATAPIAVKTLFGWIVLGATSNRKNNNIAAFTVTTGDTKIETQLKQFWELEEVVPKPIYTKEESDCQKLYETTTQRLANGKYQVRLPFVDNRNPTLGQSREQAVKRYLQLQKKLAANPILERDYTRCLNEYVDLGHMEIVDPPTLGAPAYYIPHHAVFKDSTTTKLRVVFDASAKTTNGYSLNEFLLKGPTIQPKLFSTLLNWRKYKVAMNADIEKMYRMIEVHPDHRTYQRIIWHHPITKKMQDFQLNTVTFGTSAAPYLAIRTLHELANDEKTKWPIAANAVLNSFYVDDLLTGAETIKEAETLQTDLIELMKSGGFNLRKWSSNDSRLLNRLPIDYREPRSEKCFSEDGSIKTIGIQWLPSQDYFSFKINPIPNKLSTTKRIILSEIASLYDPLGWLAPILIRGKILMQLLWITGSQWDNNVSEPIEQQWREFKQDLKNVERIKIPRWINYSQKAKIQLHGFCDASERAYAAVVYMRILLPNGIVVVHLLTSKTRVAPVKPITIPRLELNGAVLLTRLIQTTISDMQLNDVTVFAWTDSTIVLQWIQDHPSKWKPYVANRIVEIQDVIKFEHWRHVPTKMNPADLASRGASAAQLVTQTLWWNGPHWLTKNTTEWPKYPTKLGHTKCEEKPLKIVNFVSTPDNQFLVKYSSFTKLIRVIALVRRFLHNCKNIQTKNFHQLSCIEMQEAENVVLRMVQQTAFPQEYYSLLHKKPIQRSSKLLTLNPFMNKDKLIRVGGRLENAQLTYNRKHPIILPYSHHITSIIINKAHIETLHGGTSLMINTIRDKYWIINARRAITVAVHKCIKCARQRSVITAQLMGNLPVARLQITKAFSKVGIDYAGPIIIKASTLRNAKLQKAYISIFVCMVTKAIHIELVSDLTSEAFLAALKRFIARRGKCTDIYSDCGSNFIGASKILRKENQQLHKTQQTTGALFCTNKGITWHFNPPSSPHFGGLWEAGVKSIKHHLRRVLGNAICTFEEYATVLTQIEACLNSRPLCYVPNDPDEMFILTPGHFLIGQSLNAIVENEALDTQVTPSQRWKLLQQLNEQFWNKWSKDYLNQLQNRPKWQTEQRNLQPGEIVLIKSEQMPPTIWPLAIVEKIFPGQDGLVRVVQVRSKNGVFQRPITKLCRLPIDRS